MGTSVDNKSMHRLILGYRSGLVFFVAGMQCFLAFWLWRRYQENSTLEFNGQVATGIQNRESLIYCMPLSIINRSSYFFLESEFLRYHIYPCISRTPILKPKNKFFLFLGKNFIEKFILAFSFRHAMVTRKNLSWTFLISVFDPCLSWGRFFGSIFRL